MVSMDTTLAEARRQVEEAMAGKGLGGRHRTNRTADVLGREVGIDRVDVAINFYESGNKALYSALEAQSLLSEAGKAKSADELLGFLGGAQSALHEAEDGIFEVLVYLASTKGTAAYPFDSEDELKLINVERNEDGVTGISFEGFDVEGEGYEDGEGEDAEEGADDAEEDEDAG
jgi:hypothetical protein